MTRPAYSIALISTGPPDISEFGLRALSAYLKAKGVRVIKIFLPGGTEHYIYGYDQRILDCIGDILGDIDIVGISFMSNYLERAMALTKYLKNKDKTVVWGGIHSTVLPEKSLKHADFAVIGEGEKALYSLIVSLTDKKGHSDIKNIYYRGQDNKIEYRGQYPLIKDLDGLPYMDYGIEDSYILRIDTGKIESLSKDLFVKTLMLERPFGKKAVPSLKIYTSRGCPFSCSYCANSTLKEIYSGNDYLRFESPDRVIDRLVGILDDFPGIGAISIFDDVFTARKKDDIHYFCKEYREKIGLPFQIQVSPNHIFEDILIDMLDSGLFFIEMGIQSLAYNTQKLYRRKIKEKKLLNAVKLINKYKKSMNSPCYHVILDNPWESLNDNLNTLSFLLKLPKPFWLKRASLVLFPGTILYEKGKREGILTNEQRQIFRKDLIIPDINYINFLFYLAGKSYIPSHIIRLLSKRVFTGIFKAGAFNYPVGAIMWCIDFSELIFKGIISLFTGDFNRVIAYLKRRKQ